MTYYLGLSAGDHSPAACLIEDNKIIAIGEEERFIGFKHAFNQLPIKAVGYCLKEAGIKLKDVEKVGFNWHYGLYARKFYVYNPIYNLFSFLEMRGKPKLLQKTLSLYYGAEVEIQPLEHHITHIYSSIPLSGFKNGLSISVDGVGENVTTLIYDFKNKKKIKEFYRPDSLGFLYKAFTMWLGFGDNQEGKTMGLSSYGNTVYDLSKYITYGDGSYHVKYDYWALYLELLKDFGPRRDGKIEKKHEDIAFSVQKYLEDAMLSLVNYYADDGGNLALSGGVALNCVANGRIIRESKIKNIFIQPMAGDAGCALGAAIYLAMEDGHKFKEMYHPYYGEGFDNDIIKKELEQAGVKYDYYKDPAGFAAECLVKGKIVGWFQGRSEVGPRALGNRSILADPRRAEMKDIINKRVKHREPFRPFAPSMLREDMHKYLEDAYPSPFMLLAFNVLEEKRDEIPAVVHVDGTTRPQTVTKRQNPLYYRLIKEFKKETGVPVVLNTSFNIRGKPIVRTPKEAMATFYTEDMDVLVLGNYVVKK